MPSLKSFIKAFIVMGATAVIALLAICGIILFVNGIFSYPLLTFGSVMLGILFLMALGIEKNEP